MDFIAGQTLRATATFTVDGVATDPSGVTFKTRQIPSGAEVDYVYGTAPEVTRLSPGVYRFQRVIQPSDPLGTYALGAIGTGACYANREDIFAIIASRFT